MDAPLQHTALPVQRLDPRATLPTRAHPGDAGLDLHALEPAELQPGERASIGTGIAVAIPEGYAGLVLPRSGLAARHGISLVNAPGLIDAGYRGEIRVLVLNTDPSLSWKLQAGERIAQLVISPVALPDPEEVAELSSTSRGVGGFGSSGT
ncbi:MAG TPA: dUTP diphosphatase [Solirubrobacteraceae bacterium]|jgi:dUTP pyrophosphatase|nr:dUTP diphosphatase [Solirubrobacteraceae bacterium]